MKINLQTPDKINLAGVLAKAKEKNNKLVNKKYNQISIFINNLFLTFNCLGWAVFFGLDN